MRLRGIAVCIACALLAACSQKPKLECSNTDAQSTTIDLLKAQIEKGVTENLKSGDSGTSVLSSKIRATIQQLVFSLDDIRTSKVDPNSTKKFCTANLKIVIPADVVADAEKARSDTNLNDLSALADSDNVERSANAFTTSFDYDVQPTDDGQKVFAESDNLDKPKAFFGEVLASSLLKNAVEQAQIQKNQTDVAQQQQQQAALSEQKSADQAQAKTENQLSNQTISAIWKNLPPESRASMLDDERNWIRKKTADCAVEEASSSTDPTEQETARLKCDTKANQARIQMLQSSTGNPEYPPPPPPPPGT